MKDEDSILTASQEVLVFLPQLGLKRERILGNLKATGVTLLTPTSLRDALVQLDLRPRVVFTGDDPAGFELWREVKTYCRYIELVLIEGA